MNEILITSFTYDKEKYMLTTFASDIGCRIQVPRDMSIKNPKTNRSVSFMLVGVSSDPGGDKQYWEYRCTQNNESVRNLKVRIYND